MAQRATTTQAAVPAAGAGDTQAMLGNWSGSQAEANAAKVKAAMEGTAASSGAASSSMGALARVMNGPLMQAFWGVSSFAYMPMMFGQMVGPVLQWIDGLTGSAQAAQVATLAQQGLGTAITQDSGYIGANTAAMIQNILVKSNLNDLSQKIGVSQAALIEAAAGEVDAQGNVTDAYNRKQAAIEADIKAGKLGIDAGTMQSLQLQDQKNAFDDLTKSVVKSMNTDREQSDALTAADKTTQIYNATVNDLTAKMRLQAEQADLTAAAQAQYLATLIPGTQQYTAAINDQFIALQANARQAAISAAAQENYLQTLLPGTAAYTQAVQTQQAAILQAGSSAGITAIAQLNLGTATQQVGDALYGAVDAYSQAAAGASGYKTVVDALNGSQLSMDQAQNTLAQAMLNAEKTFRANSESLNLNTTAGVQNRQALVSASQAIIAMGVAQYEATGNINSANAMMQAQIDAFVKATGATGKSKDAIVAYLEQIVKIPPNVSTTVHADVGPALSQVHSLVTIIDSLSASVSVGTVAGSGGHGGPVAYAHGGVVGAAASGGVRGGRILLGEDGPEIADLPYGTTVHSNADSQQMGAGGAPGGGWDGQPLVMQVIGDPDSWLVQALRHNVRVISGSGPDSVQKAFGQSF